jgi:hypothetical protein
MSFFNKGSKILSSIIISNDTKSYQFNYLLDTGSDMTFISERIFTGLNFKPASVSGTATFGNNLSIPIRTTEINMTLPTKIYDIFNR